MGAYVGAFFIFAYIFISKNKLLSLLSAPIIISSSNKLFFHNNLLIFFLAYLLSMV